MAETTAAYTHRMWTADMAAMRDLLRRIAAATEQGLASLRRLDAGRTQIEMFTDVLIRLTERAAQADQILGEVGRVYNPVNEAQAAAGGLPEVYGEKTAHQRG